MATAKNAITASEPTKHTKMPTSCKMATMTLTPMTAKNRRPVLLRSREFPSAWSTYLFATTRVVTATMNAFVMSPTTSTTTVARELRRIRVELRRALPVMFTEKCRVAPRSARSRGTPARGRR